MSSEFGRDRTTVERIEVTERELALRLHDVMCDWSSHAGGLDVDPLHLTRYRHIAGRVFRRDEVPEKSARRAVERLDQRKRLRATGGTEWTPDSK